MPTWRLERVSEEPASCHEVEHDGCAGSAPDLHAALHICANNLERKARGWGHREPGDYAGGPR